MYSVADSLPSSAGGMDGWPSAARLGGIAVGAAEAQAVLDGVQLGKAPGLLGGGDVALHPGLERAAPGAAGIRRREGALGLLPRPVQQVIEDVEIGLFGAERGRAG